MGWVSRHAESPSCSRMGLAQEAKGLAMCKPRTGGGGGAVSSHHVSGWSFEVSEGSVHRSVLTGCY